MSLKIAQHTTACFSKSTLLKTEFAFFVSFVTVVTVRRRHLNHFLWYWFCVFIWKIVCYFFLFWHFSLLYSCRSTISIGKENCIAWSWKRNERIHNHKVTQARIHLSRWVRCRRCQCSVRCTIRWTKQHANGKYKLTYLLRSNWDQLAVCRQQSNGDHLSIQIIAFFCPSFGADALHKTREPFVHTQIRFLFWTECFRIRISLYYDVLLYLVCQFFVVYDWSKTQNRRYKQELHVAGGHLYAIKTRY